MHLRGRQDFLDDVAEKRVVEGVRHSWATMRCMDDDEETALCVSSRMVRRSLQLDGRG